ncbi:ATP-binding protein [Streptomyces sp. BE20]|uniref:ATP-binding protein n=1 Tax=Streptomyces sp. BE20 TaxID=3002525 RepID=UPI002E77A713|nr:ATP-binding protein [Streptomyces sp. BE20]MEE1826167.1 ATP-binding protein [Streptomyces sp. BE20]
MHARIAAETAGVSVRTVWRWLAEARESGRVEAAPRRGGFTVTDKLWDRLSELGGNVAALHRELTAQADRVAAPGSAGSVPSLGTLHRAVQQERRAGRVLHGVRPGRGRVEPAVYDRALAELALPGTVGETGQTPAGSLASSTVPAPGALPALSAVPDGSATVVPSGVLLGVRLYVPGAHVVATSQSGEVTEALAHTVAARGIACVYGDAGQGKTVAVHQALGLLPRRLPVCLAQVAVKSALPQLRAALLTAFGLPATALTNRTDAADRALIDAFKTPGVLLIDDVQRIAAPELDYLRLLADAPTTQMSLVLCGAGAERTLARARALASRVLTWQHVPRLETSQIPTVLRLFHPLWHTATDADLLHTDETCARGNFRTWAKITSHAYAALDQHPGTGADRALLSKACSRLGPNP